MTLRSRRIATALGVAAALAVVATAPASAVTTPDWPASRLPNGANCTITAYTPYGSSSSGLNDYTFADSQTPVVTDWTVNNQTAALVLAPGSTLGTFRISVTQTCGGVGSVTSGVVIGQNRVSDNFPFIRDSTDAFHSVWAASVPLNPASAGIYRIPTANVSPRYATFTLSDIWTLVGKTDFAGAPATVTGPWSTKVFYVLCGTTQTPSATRTSVAKGGKVTFRTLLRKAGVSTYIASAGSIVRFQTRLPGGAWVTRATVKTNAAGIASTTYAPPRTMTWRWVHTTTTSGAYTAGSISAVRTIKVT